MMKPRFEPHEKPYWSRLEKWRAEITEMRRQNWPYSKIVEWLRTEGPISVTREAVRKFCQVRKIRKGSGKNIVPQIRKSSQPVEKSTGRLFEYKDDGPIKTNRQ